jgi:hypothetical protein
MDLYPYNTEAFIKYCIQKAMKESISEEGENAEASKAFSDSSEEDQDSLVMFYLRDDDEIDNQSPLSEYIAETDTIHTPTFVVIMIQTVI